MANNEFTTTLSRRAHAGSMLRTTVFVAALGAAVGPFGNLAVAGATYDANWYEWCMNNLEEGSDYCCEHAGGVVRQGACINPDDLQVVEASPTSQPTRRPLPDVGATFTQVAPADPMTPNSRAPIAGIPTTAVMAP